MIPLQQISLQIAERLRDYATDGGNVPVRSGELRKAHVTMPFGAHDAILTANTPYAAAVHEGRPAITIRPKSRKALLWSGAAHPARVVHQPARAGNPWMRRAVEMLSREGLDFLAPQLGPPVAKALSDALRAQGFT